MKVPSKLKAFNTKLNKAARLVEEHPLVRLATGLAVIIAIIAFVIDLGDRRGDRITRAWQTLTIEATGNSGKAQALEVLANSGEVLHGLNLGCIENSSEDYCAEGIYLSNLDLSRNFLTCCIEISNTNFLKSRLDRANMNRVKIRKSEFLGALLRNVDFSNAMLTDNEMSYTRVENTNFFEAKIVWSKFINSVLHDTNFRGADITATTFDNAHLRNAVFANSQLSYVNFNKADLTNADFSGVIFSDGEIESKESDKVILLTAQKDSNLVGTNFKGANLSGVIFDDPLIITDPNITASEMFKGAFYLPENPPKGLATNNMNQLIKCDIGGWDQIRFVKVSSTEIRVGYDAPDFCLLAESQ